MRTTITEQDYLNSSIPFDDATLEAQCRCRGVRMAFLTLAPSIGLRSVRLMKELYSVMNSPMTNQLGSEVMPENEVFLRMTYWASRAHEDITLFSPSELAAFERCAESVLGKRESMTQKRFEKLLDVVLYEPMNQEPAHLNRMN